MSNSRNDGVPERTNNPPLATLAPLEDDFSNLSLAQAPTAAAFSTRPAEEPFLCTICYETQTPVVDRILMPACNHSFCIDCLLSWATVRGVCPNCKAPFTSLFVHRGLNGDVVPGPWTENSEPPWILENIALLRSVEWVKLSEIHSAQHDIEASFALPPIRDTTPEARATAAASSSSAAPHYLCEEVEDELEDRFWEEEEKQYNRLMRSTRVISNRRFGPKGYISSGHMRAKPKPNPPQHPKKVIEASGAGSSQSHANANNQNETVKGKPAGSSGGARKKKVKKKSRAGLAAAAAARAAADAEANKRGGSSSSLPSLADIASPPSVANCGMAAGGGASCTETCAADGSTAG